MCDKRSKLIKKIHILFHFEHDFQPSQIPLKPLRVCEQDKMSLAFTTNTFSVGIYIELAKSVNIVNLAILLYSCQITI